MSVIELPSRKRLPAAVRNEPAAIVRHPAAPTNFAAETAQMQADIAKRQANAETERQMGSLQLELDLFVLKIEAVARANKCEGQAVFMLEMARALLKERFYPGSL